MTAAARCCSAASRSATLPARGHARPMARPHARRRPCPGRPANCRQVIPVPSVGLSRRARRKEAGPECCFVQASRTNTMQIDVSQPTFTKTQEGLESQEGCSGRRCSNVCIGRSRPRVCRVAFPGIGNSPLPLKKAGEILERYVKITAGRMRWRWWKKVLFYFPPSSFSTHPTDEPTSLYCLLPGHP